MELHPIKELIIKTAVPVDKLIQNVLDADRSYLKPIDILLGSARRDGAIALVGGGPSLSKTIGQALQYEKIIIAGSAHDYVLNAYMPGPHQDVYCIVCDADPIMCKYLQNWSPNITYLICSQCDKSLFELLKNAPKKYLWHANSGDDFNKTVFKEGTKLIVGGCTIGTRAIGMAMALGYKKIYLFGYDSCLDKNYKHHAYDFEDPDNESLGEIKEIKIDGEDSPVFRVAGYMLAQIFDFQTIIGTYYQDLDIEVFGDGALAYIMKVAKAKAKEQLNGKR